MNGFLAEYMGLKQFAAPVDGNTAAITGARVSMKGSKKVTFALLMGASTGATVIASLKQHNAASGGTTKALSVANAYFYKAGAATVFTKVEPTVAADSYDVSTQFAADAGILVLEVLESQLDTNGGFTHVSVDLADTGAAKIVAGLYMVDADALPAYSVAL